MNDYDSGRKLAISDFGSRSAEMMRSQLTDVFEDQVNQDFSKFYDDIAMNMVPYLEEGLSEVAQEGILGFKELEGIVKGEYLKKVSFDALGNKTEISRRAKISTKQVTRIMDYQNLNAYNESNLPDNPLEERTRPVNDFFDPEYVREVYEKAIDDTFYDNRAFMNPDVKDKLKVNTYELSKEVAAKLNGLDLAFDMSTKAGQVAKDAMDILGAYGHYTLKELEDLSGAVLFKYVFDSTGGDFSETADLLKMGERNARRLHKQFKENDWGRKVVDDKKVIKVDFRTDSIDRLAA